MDGEQLIHVARVPSGFCAGRLAGAALVLLALLGLMGGQGLPWLLRLGLGAAVLGAAAAQQYARRCLLTRTALLLVAPLGTRLVPLQSIEGLSVGRRGPLSCGLGASLLSAELFLPPYWSGVSLTLKDGSRLFVPACDAQALARELLSLCPHVRWDDLSENDYFAFLAQKRPQAWPRLTRSSIQSGSIPSSGSPTSRSVPSRV